MKKFLILIFIFLIAVILSELVYLVYISKASASYTQKIDANKSIFTETRNNTSAEYKNLKTEPAIHPTMLNWLKNYFKSPESRLYILSEERTKVLDIARKGACVEDRRNGVLYPGQICFPFAMKLQNKTLPEGYIWTYLTESQVNKTRVYIKDEKGQRKAELKDIQVNDTIFSTEKWDPSVPWDMNNLKQMLDQQMIEFSIYIEKP